MTEPDYAFYQQLGRELFARKGRLSLLSRLRLSILSSIEYLQAARHLVPLQPTYTGKLPTSAQVVESLDKAYRTSDTSRLFLAARVGLEADFEYWYQRLVQAGARLETTNLYRQIAASGSLALYNRIAAQFPLGDVIQKIRIVELALFYGNLELGLALYEDIRRGPRSRYRLPEIEDLMAFAIRSMSPSTLEGLWNYRDAHTTPGNKGELYLLTNNRFFWLSVDYQNLFGVEFFASKVNPDFPMPVALERVISLGSDNLELFQMLERLCRQRGQTPDYPLLLQKARQYQRFYIEDYLTYPRTLQQLLLLSGEAQS